MPRTFARRLAPHDNRYEVAAEYVEVLYKLFEAAGEDGGRHQGCRRGINTDPAKVHEIGPQGKISRFPAITSASRRRSARRSSTRPELPVPARPLPPFIAMCLRGGADQSLLKELFKDIRALAAAAGRDPRKLQIYNLTNAHHRRDRRKGQKRFEDYANHSSYDGALTFVSGWSGIDFGQLCPADLLKRVETNAVVSVVEHFAGKDKQWTVEACQMGRASAASAQFSSARPTTMPTFSRTGRRTPTSTGSNSLMR